MVNYTVLTTKLSPGRLKKIPILKKLITSLVNLDIIKFLREWIRPPCRYGGVLTEAGLSSCSLPARGTRETQTHSSRPTPFAGDNCSWGGRDKYQNLENVVERHQSTGAAHEVVNTTPIKVPSLYRHHFNPCYYFCWKNGKHVSILSNIWHLNISTISISTISALGIWLFRILPFFLA